VPPDQVCCGAPSLHLGDTAAVRTLAQQNLTSFSREDPDVIITVCPTGYSLLKNHYSLIDSKAASFAVRVHDFSAFLASQRGLPPATAAAKAKVYYHYPCHYLNELRPGDAPPLLLRSLGFDLTEQKEPPTCCGFCGVFSARNPEISAHLWNKKKEDILKSGASLVATDCPGCLFQLRSGLKAEAGHIRAFHTAEIFSGLLEETSPSEKAKSRLSRDCQGKDLDKNQ